MSPALKPRSTSASSITVSSRSASVFHDGSRSASWANAVSSAPLPTVPSGTSALMILPSWIRPLSSLLGNRSTKSSSRVWKAPADSPGACSGWLVNPRSRSPIRNRRSRSGSDSDKLEIAVSKSSSASSTSDKSTEARNRDAASTRPSPKSISSPSDLFSSGISTFRIGRFEPCNSSATLLSRFRMSSRQTFLNCETMSWKFVSAVKLKPVIVFPDTDSVTSGSVWPETCSSRSGSR